MCLLARFLSAATRAFVWHSAIGCQQGCNAAAHSYAPNCMCFCDAAQHADVLPLPCRVREYRLLQMEDGKVAKIQRVIQEVGQGGRVVLML
jgi:hypothetical protein